MEFLDNMAVLIFLRNLQAIFHNGCINLHAHRQWTRIPLFPHPHQYLWFVFFLMMAIWQVWFWSSSPWWLVMLGIFSCTHWLSSYSLWNKKCLFRFCAHFHSNVFLLSVWVPYIFRYEPLTKYKACRLCSHSAAAFSLVHSFICCTEAS